MNITSLNQAEVSPARREQERGYLFVTGCKRSATEFINHSFDSHPKLLNVVVEFYAFEYLAKNPDLADAIVGFARTAPVAEVYDSFHRRGFLPCFDRRNVRPGAWPDPELDTTYFELDFDKERFLDYFDGARAHGLNSVAGLVKTWFACLKRTPPFDAQPEARWLLKCADFGLTLQSASQLSLLDSAVFSIRHPIAIVNSIKRLRMEEEHRDFHIFQLIEVCRAIDNIPNILKSVHGDVRVIRYEDFASSPSQVVHDLANSWGIGSHPALDRPTVLGQPWTTNSSFRDGQKPEIVLTKTEQRTILSRTTRFREAFGYPD